MNEFSFLRRTYLSFALWCFPTSSARKLIIHLEYWMKWNEILALWIVILLSVTQLIIQVIQAASFFFVLWCHLTFSFDQVDRSPNSQHHCSWHYIDVGEGNWDFDELNEVLLWIDSKFTHFVVYWFWQSVKCTFRA